MILNNELDKGFAIGTVKKVNFVNRKVAVFIPKFMPGIIEDGTERFERVNHSNNAEFNFTYANKVKTTSYVWISALNYNEPMPKIGSKVIIYFIEGSMKNALWAPFNFNNQYEVDEREKYKNIGDINGLDFLEKDSIEFTFETFKVKKSKSDKSLNLNFYLTEEEKNRRKLLEERKLENLEVELLQNEESDSDAYKLGYIYSARILDSAIKKSDVPIVAFNDIKYQLSDEIKFFIEKDGEIQVFSKNLSEEKIKIKKILLK